MKYFKLNAPKELLRCPFVDKQCVGDSCMAWKQKEWVNSKFETIVYKDEGYCGAIWK